MHTSCVFAIPMKEKSAENVVQAYLSGIFTHRGGTIAILSDSGTELKKNQTVLNEACNSLTSKNYLQTCFIPRQLKNKKCAQFP